MGDTFPVPFILSCPQMINWKQRHGKYTVTYTPQCVNDMWNKSYMNCGNEIKMKKWSSQWTQFMQLRKEAWKKKKKIQDFNGVWTPDLAITGAMLYQLIYEAWSIVGSYVPVKEMSVNDIRNNCINCVHRDDHFFIHFHFISAVHIFPRPLAPAFALGSLRSQATGSETSKSQRFTEIFVH